MKRLFSILFVALAFTCQSQNDVSQKNPAETDGKSLTVGTNESVQLNSSTETDLQETITPNAIESTGPVNADDKIEKEKKDNRKKSTNKKGKRVQVNPVYIIVGIVVVAVVIYFATSHNTTKM